MAGAERRCVELHLVASGQDIAGASHAADLQGASPATPATAVFRGGRARARLSLCRFVMEYSF